VVELFFNKTEMPEKEDLAKKTKITVKIGEPLVTQEV
jgi:hypothetical protein